jgi:hypothetical protein
VLRLLGAGSTAVWRPLAGHKRATFRALRVVSRFRDPRFARFAPFRAYRDPDIQEP